jgi:hypothetical protein
LKNKAREVVAATGQKQDEFETGLKAFAEADQERDRAQQTVTGHVRQRRQGGGNTGKLRGMEDKRLFILVYQKTYPLQTLLGLPFGISQGRVNEWMHRLTPLLQQALTRLSMTPERDGQAVPSSALAMEGRADLVIDGTERRGQRSQRATLQKAHYRGPKSAHRWLLPCW